MISNELRAEIIRMNKDQLSSVFWQVYGGIKIDHETEIDEIITEAVYDVRVMR